MYNIGTEQENKSISILAPVRRRPRSRRSSAPAPHFNSRPREEASRPATCARLYTVHFNSRPREEASALAQAKASGAFISILAPVRRRRKFGKTA